MVAALTLLGQAVVRAAVAVNLKMVVLEIRHQQPQVKEVMAARGLQHPMAAAAVAVEQAQSVAPQQTQAAAELAARAVLRPSLEHPPTMLGAVGAVQQLLQPLLAVQVVVAMAHSLTTSQQWLARLTQVVAGAVVI
jgi:hypothetical protein